MAISSFFVRAVKDVMIPCRCCDGKGKQLLRGALRATLEVVPMNQFISTEEVELELDDSYVKRTAISNRLAQLKGLKLVVSEERGKALFWKRLK